MNDLGLSILKSSCIICITICTIAAVAYNAPGLVILAMVLYGGPCLTVALITLADLINKDEQFIAKFKEINVVNDKDKNIFEELQAITYRIKSILSKGDFHVNND